MSGAIVSKMCPVAALSPSGSFRYHESNIASGAVPKILPHSCVRGYANEGFVFTTPRGTPLNPANLTQREFKPLLKSAGLDPKQHRLYDLRHTTATLLLSANVHPKIVSERLGHASVAITLDTYSHVLPSMQQTATDELSRMLFPAATQ
jgi:integrase